MIKVGFIGTGNMGGALATAASKSENAELYLSNKPAEVAEKLSEKIGGTVVDNDAVAKQCDYIFLGVKPQHFSKLVSEIGDLLKERKDDPVLVSMMAGTPLAQVEADLGLSVPMIRVMPNIPCKVQEGMVLYTHNDKVTEQQLAEFLDFMKAAGEFSPIEESLMAAGTGVSGCGPAFAALFVDALADGGVACGLPRKDAVKFAAQMLKGTAQYILEEGVQPGELKDAVCSPGGTTIQGVRTLEENGFRGSVTDAVISTVEKDKSL